MAWYLHCVMVEVVQILFNLIIWHRSNQIRLHTLISYWFRILVNENWLRSIDQCYGMCNTIQKGINHSHGGKISIEFWINVIIVINKQVLIYDTFIIEKKTWFCYELFEKKWIKERLTAATHRSSCQWKSYIIINYFHKLVL